MAESLREGILAHLETTLAGMTVLGGYVNDIGTITRGLLAPLEGGTFPCASVLPAQDVPEAGASSVSRRELTCAIRAWVDTALVTETAQALEAFVADIQRALQVDTTRGGLAEYTMEGPLQYIYLEARGTMAGADIGIEIHYRTAIGSPLSGPS